MNLPAYQPIYQLTRGGTLESLHYGAVAIVDVEGRLVARHGDPHTITFLRSTAKPFQALPLVEASVQGRIDLSPQEIALVCASHAGTDDHVAVAQGLQGKGGLAESDLLCGVHPPYDPDTQRQLQARSLEPTPNRHNCSGKHTGMLVLAHLNGWPLANYIDPGHPVQQAILTAFAEMCALPPEEIAVGIDGCSAPNFAVPLYHAALAYARLSDARGLEANRRRACEAITAAMRAHPILVSGPGRFDTRLMTVAGGRLVAKGGAEGYQGLGLLPGALGPGSPALGIAIKISDGDPRGRALPGVALEALRQLGALDEAALADMAEFGPARPVYNWRKIVVGTGEPCLDLDRS